MCIEGINGSGNNVSGGTWGTGVPSAGLRQRAVGGEKNAVMYWTPILYPQEDYIAQQGRGNKREAAEVDALAASIGIIAGCTSAPKQKTDVLDNKGAALGIPTPDWVTAYVSGGNYTVEALPEYKSDHCFVVYYADSSRDFAVNWVENASGPAQVAQVISTTVLSDAKEKSAGVRGEAVGAAFESAAQAMSSASFTGMRKAGDWWQIVRNKDTKVQEAQAFALYTVDKRRLDEQIAINLTNIVENNKVLSAAERAIYRDLIADIRANGFNNR